MSAWLPSRRSTLHQVGASVMTRLGQRRLGRSTTWKGRYRSIGILFIFLVSLARLAEGMAHDRRKMKNLLVELRSGGSREHPSGARLRKKQLAGNPGQAHGEVMVPRFTASSQARPPAIELP